jgi:hypothetical protein|nr:MAG TPA: Rad52/22 family double-strand break repair protein [Caudoviricetes sp.]
MDFRYLKAEEIECRVATCNEKGVSLLVYKDARVDANVLDETVGCENWQCKFYEQKGTLFCSVGIVNPDTLEWTWKDDAGSPSNMEADKGEASDAFKRACFKWGIGRELYTAPFIWVPAERCNIRTGRNGKLACYDRFRVEKIEINNGRIKNVSIWNETTGKRAFVHLDKNGEAK